LAVESEARSDWLPVDEIKLKDDKDIINNQHASEKTVSNVYKNDIL